MNDDPHLEYRMTWHRAEEAALLLMISLMIAGAALSLLRVLEDTGRLDLDGRQWALAFIIAAAFVFAFNLRRGIARAFKDF